MADYFVRRESKVFGPLAGGKVLGLAKAGKIQPTDEIATDKSGPWKPITTVTSLRTVFAQSNVDPLGPATADPLGIRDPQQVQTAAASHMPPLSQIDGGRASGQSTTPIRTNKPSGEQKRFTETLLFKGVIFGFLAILVGVIVVVVGYKLIQGIADTREYGEGVGTRAVERAAERQQEVELKDNLRLAAIRNSISEIYTPAAAVAWEAGYNKGLSAKKNIRSKGQVPEYTSGSPKFREGFDIGYNGVIAMRLFANGLPAKYKTWE